MILQLLLVTVTAILTALCLNKPQAWKKIVAITLLAYPTIIVLNLLSYWIVLKSVDSSLLNAGWAADPYLRKASAHLLTLAAYAGVPMILKSVLKANSRQTALSLAVWYVALNMTLYAVSRPDPGQVVNPNTGDYLYKYYRDTERSCVDRFPRHFEYHPNRIGVNHCALKRTAYRAD